jgi:hypothetical protein
MIKMNFIIGHYNVWTVEGVIPFSDFGGAVQPLII